jgi:hypothetical protein
MLPRFPFAEKRFNCVALECLNGGEIIFALAKPRRLREQLPDKITTRTCGQNPNYSPLPISERPSLAGKSIETAA